MSAVWRISHSIRAQDERWQKNEAIKWLQYRLSVSAIGMEMQKLAKFS
jgi:hypothetical protein